jgi:hypothetical protein
MSLLNVNKVDPATGTGLELGSSGDTITIPSGATITNSGTATGFGQSMTPMFAARRTSGQLIADNTYVKVEFATEDIDTDSAFDNSSNYRFTVPSGKAGKYLFSFNVAIASRSGVSTAKQVFIALYKNNSLFVQNFFDGRDGAFGDTMTGAASYILDCAVSDYFEVFAKINDSGSSGGNVQSDAASFSGVRLLAS